MNPFIISVAGGSGSGKSTVTEQIYQSLNGKDIVVFLLDNYYLDRSDLSLEERGAINFDHPDALDWTLMGRHLEDLYNGKSIEMPVYDFTTHTRRLETKQLNPAKVIVMEGLFALYDKTMHEKMALKIFVDTASDIRLIRRLRRDIIDRGRTIDSVLEQYIRHVRPMYKKFIDPTKKFADIIIPHGSNKAALEMLISRIQNVLNEAHIPIDESYLFNKE